MREVRCSREASRYLEENASLVPDVWAALFGLREANQPPGEPYLDLYVIETENHAIYYAWESADSKLVTVIKPLP